MSGFVDLHCHYVPSVDDGARSLEESRLLLGGLRELGFELVIATPHMRPGLFDNDREALVQSFAALSREFAQEPGLPERALSCEHYFDELVFGRFLSGEALCYPGQRAALLEFYQIGFPPLIEARLFDLKVRGVLPIIAHPERYQCLWRSSELLERLVEQGAAALLDIAALVGKYGRMSQKCAEHLLERGLYHAACSDAHRPADLSEVAAGMRRLRQLYGTDELEFLFRTGPGALLQGALPE